MADSGRARPDYAPTAAAPPTAGRAGDKSRRRFRPQFWPTLAALLLVPLFLAAGQWQWNKAEKKAQLQNELETLAAGPPVAMPTTLADADALRFRRVAARGRYEPQYQILIDNRLHQGRAGYHVITPLRLEGSEVRLLVNRGWVPGLAEHHEVPVIDTPGGLVEAEGVAIVPSTRFFTLGTPAADQHAAWQDVWQNLDLQRYATELRFPVQPVVLQLDPQSAAGGFVRDWPRLDDRRQVNVGYALQWWTFAATTIFLWLFFNLRRVRAACPSSEPT